VGPPMDLFAAPFRCERFVAASPAKLRLEAPTLSLSPIGEAITTAGINRRLTMPIVREPLFHPCI